MPSNCSRRSSCVGQALVRAPLPDFPLSERCIFVLQVLRPLEKSVDRLSELENFHDLFRDLSAAFLFLISSQFGLASVVAQSQPYDRTSAAEVAFSSASVLKKAQQTLTCKLFAAAGLSLHFARCAWCLILKGTQCLSWRMWFRSLCGSLERSKTFCLASSPSCCTHVVSKLDSS